MSYRTDSQRVAPPRSGQGRRRPLVAQGLTAVALVPLTLLFIFPFARNLGGDYEAVRATYPNPVPRHRRDPVHLRRGHHFHQGLQVVIEDYVHDKAMRTARCSPTCCWAGRFALTGVFAVAKIAFTA